METSTEPNRARQHGGAIATSDLAVLDNLMAAGQMLATQQASASDWSPEKRLAAAVLASALVEIRDHHADRSYGRRIEQDLEWIGSEEAEWPFSFVRLCQVFDLDPAWVREAVARWMARPTSAGRPATPYRQAA
jgi:hypothetical protein